MRLRIPALAGLAFAALLLAPAAQAAHDPDWEGWFFELEGALVTPGNTNTATFATSPSFAGAVEGFESDVEWIDWDDDVAFRGAIGYSFGSMGALRVSYWSYDDTTENSGVNSDIYAAWWFTVGPRSNVYYSYYPIPLSEMSWDFEQTIEASAIDLEYTRTKQVGNPLTLTYGVGVRYASFEDTVDGHYRLLDVIAPATFNFAASRSIDSDGVGLTGSVGAEYDFSDVFGIGTDLRVGFLDASVDMEHSLVDVDNYAAAVVNVPPSWTESESFEDEMATTVDFSFDLTFHTGPYLDVEVGYVYTRWTDMVEFNLSRSSDGILDAPLIPGEERDQLSWSGPQLRLRFHL